MLDSDGFDLWADGYDKSVGLSERADAYPFAGYQDTLNEIYRAVRRKRNARVLDIGFGTGVLTKKLYDDGYAICGVDFSQRMIEIAKEKMPNATLLRHDFSKGLPDALRREAFDFIVSTYAIHHLTDEGKAALLTALLGRLAPGGAILLGDVAFETRAELDACRRQSGDAWDADEIYIVADELRRHLPAGQFHFHRTSHCAGVVTLTNGTAEI